MQEIIAPFLAAAGMGLMGAGHCMSMCGGIVAAVSMRSDGGASRQSLQLGYNLGRISTYALLGGLVAAFAAAVPSAGLPVARTFAGVLLVLVGLHFLGSSRGIVALELVGQVLWRKLRPIASALMPVNHPGKAFLAGAVWGWLPCGLVYSALVYAASQTSFAAGAGVMLAFGVGTLPALLLGGMVAEKLQRWFRLKRVRTFVACAYIVFGLWTAGVPWYHTLAHEGHHSTSDAPTHTHQQNLSGENSAHHH